MAFGFHSTTLDVLKGVDLSGKFAVVTGGNAGLGWETVRALGSAGAEILLTARSDERGREAIAKLEEAVPGGKFSYDILKLDSLESIRRFASDTLAAHERIDLLINNAGIMAPPLQRTEEGFESQFGTNHLGHFLLTNLLMPALLKAAPARVVSLASAGHHMSDILWDDPNFEHNPYDKWKGYGQAKTANILFTIELNRRFADQGVDAFAAHPGSIRTGLSAHFTDQDRSEITDQLTAANRPLNFKSIEGGAATSVWAATAPELQGHGGVYLEDCQVSRPGVAGSFEGLAPWAADPDSARRLWDLSERLVGELVTA